MTTETEAPAQEAPAKPRGACTGCKFDYQLGTARTGEFKGQSVIRKHNSRTGPGLCSGAQRPPAGAEPEPAEAETAQFMMPGHVHNFGWADDGNGHSGSVCECGAIESDPVPHLDETDVSSAPQEGKGPWIEALHYGECSGCGNRIEPGNIIRADGEGGWEISGCPDNVKPGRYPTLAEDNVQACQLVLQAHQTSPSEHLFTDVSGVEWSHPGNREACVLPECVLARTAPAGDGRTPDQQAEIDRRMADPVGSALATLPDPSARDTVVAAASPPQFMTPGAASDIPDGSVSMQPEPDRDRWGRYVFHGNAHTRATTFAKSAASTFTLNEWQQRMVILGLTQRPDLMALAHGLNVRDDKKTLNSIAEQAKEHAGSKVAANLGTAYHAFSERLDAGLITLDDIPELYRHRVAQYADVMRRSGLVTRREWIERSTAVRADQVSADLGVGGTLDRILQLPDGSLAIGDLKTGRDLSYGWVEIAVQLALYAHGVNTHGLFDWNTKTWGQHIATPAGMMPLQVRTDFAIVMHLPADGDGCTLYRVDIAKGWEYAQVCGRVMAMQKDKTLAYELTVPDAPPAPVIEPVAVHPAPSEDRPEMAHAKKLFREVRTTEEAAGLYGYADQSGVFSPEELNTLAQIGTATLAELPY